MGRELLQPGDTLVADCYHCTYWLIAACRQRGVHIVMKNHHKRDDHPADAVRLRKGERLVTWTRPGRPAWMSADEYAQQPATVAIRLVDVNVTRKGFRPDTFTVATTMIDDREVAGDWIRSVYESRWAIEIVQAGYASRKRLYLPFVRRESGNSHRHRCTSGAGSVVAESTFRLRTVV
jgi:hypothetical protein